MNDKNNEDHVKVNDSMFFDAILGHVIDFLDRKSTLLLCHEVIDHLSAPSSPSPSPPVSDSTLGRIADNLIKGNVIIEVPSSLRTTNEKAESSGYAVFDYFTQNYLCFTKNGFVICSGVQHNIVAASDKLSDVSGSNYDYRKLKAYVVHPSGRPTADFKLLGGAYGSSGSVCHQTSNIRLETLVSMTQDVVQRSKVPGNFLRHWKITNDRTRKAISVHAIRNSFTHLRSRRNC